MRPPFQLGSETVSAGRRKTIHLPLPEFYTHSATTMPVHVIHGRREGPTLLVTSAIHGDEINGVEIIRRLLTHNSLSGIRGTLLLIPVVNVFGFVAQSRYLPDRRDLNRSFPGSRKGSMTARLAYLVTQEILPRCTHVIDLHTGAIGRENLPQVRATLGADNPETEAMALSFNAPVVLDAALRAGTFRQCAQELGILSLVYEAGEALRFDEIAIRAGVTGTLNVMAHLGMIRKRPGRRSHTPVVSQGSSWIRAPQSGVVRSLVALGSRVKDGDILAYVSDPIGEHEEPIPSSVSGIVIGRARLPLVHEGEAVFHIARFSRPGNAAEQVETFQDEFDPVTGTSDSDEPPVVG